MALHLNHYVFEHHLEIVILMKGKYSFYEFQTSSNTLSDCFLFFRKLVTFGLQHNLIRCINKYPICTSDFPINRQKFYSGIHHVDEICCKTGLTPAKIQEDIDTDPFVVIISK